MSQDKNNNNNNNKKSIKMKKTILKIISKIKIMITMI